jgi:hypothetical protein
MPVQEYFKVLQFNFVPATNNQLHLCDGTDCQGRILLNPQKAIDRVTLAAREINQNIGINKNN